MTQLDQAAARRILERLASALRIVPSPAAQPEAWPIGTVLRYSEGSTALMLVETVSEHHGGPGHHRYWGRHCLGGAHGAYHDQCSLASAKDLATWAKHRHPKHPV